jgi:hypothetical protein
MSKTLILPDIHLRHQKAEKIVAFEKPDQIIFLGDYLDDFNDTIEMTKETAGWLHWSVNQKNRIHLCGNHDLHYWFKDNAATRCSGYDHFKSVAINDIVSKKDWEKLKFFHILDNRWLLSHAGVHPSWIDPVKFKANTIIESSLDEIGKRLEFDTVEAKRAFYANGMHWFNMPGFSRSRSPYHGGITWCDWDDEFQPIRGIHQIVGHTPRLRMNCKLVKENESHVEPPFPLVSLPNTSLTDKNSYNLCLDSREPGSRYYAIYENQELKICESVDIK